MKRTYRKYYHLCLKKDLCVCVCSYIQDKFRKIHQHILKLLIITFSHCIFSKTIYSETAFVDTNNALIFQIQLIHLCSHLTVLLLAVLVNYLLLLEK